MSSDPRRHLRERHSEPEISVGELVQPEPEPEPEFDPEAPPGSVAGELFGKYVLVGNIARGGMGELFLAVQDGLEGFRKVVVVKRVLKHLTTNADFMQMFVNEARLTARLDHPNIVKTYEFGEHDGQYYTVMEFLAGEDLGKVLQRLSQMTDKVLPLPFAVHIVAQLCNGLHFAHELTDVAGRPLGLVHRDVNPSNVLVTYAGEVKIVDFGVAKVNRAVTKTVAGTIKGKIAYMSPEHILARGVDRRSDVFSAGIVLWELLTGQPLFARDSDAATLYAVVSDPIPLPSTYRAEVPPPLDAVVARALAREPQDRFESAEALHAALDSFAETLPKVDGRALGRMMETLYGATRAEAKRAIAQSRSLARNIALVMDLRTSVRSEVNLRTEVSGDVDPRSRPTVALSTAARRRRGAPATGRGRRRGLVIVGTLAGVLAVAALHYAADPRHDADLPQPAASHGKPAGSAAPAAAPIEAVAAPVPVPPPVVPPAEPPAAAIAQPPVQGTLTVATRPRATIYLDGKLIEHGSFSGRPTENGSHELVVKAQGHAAVRRSISVEPARETRVEVLPAKRAAAATSGQPAVATRPAVVDPKVEAGPAGKAVGISHDASPTAAPPQERGSHAAAGTVSRGQEPPPVIAEAPRRVDKAEPPAAEVVQRPTIDVAATRAAVRSQLGPIQQCYERAKMDDATLKGTVTARLTVAPDGSVANVEISSSTLKSAQAERCMVGEIAHWQLPRPSGGAAISFKYPFVFE